MDCILASSGLSLLAVPVLQTVIPYRDGACMIWARRRHLQVDQTGMVICVQRACVTFVKHEQ